MPALAYHQIDIALAQLADFQCYWIQLCNVQDELGVVIA
jgi:hypothetical protein